MSTPAVKYIQICFSSPIIGNVSILSARWGYHDHEVPYHLTIPILDDTFCMDEQLWNAVPQCVQHALQSAWSKVLELRERRDTEGDTW